MPRVQMPTIQPILPGGMAYKGNVFTFDFTCFSVKLTLPLYPKLKQILAVPRVILVHGWNQGGRLSMSLILTIMVVEAVKDV